VAVHTPSEEVGVNVYISKEDVLDGLSLPDGLTAPWVLGQGKAREVQKEDTERKKTSFFYQVDIGAAVSTS
jgi:hypothetical protein